MERIESTIIQNLVFNEDFSRKVLPFVREEYFENYHEKIIFTEISKFIVKYNTLPTTAALQIEVENRTDLNDEVYKQTVESLSKLEHAPNDKQWLIDTAEKWCRDRAIYLALVESISIAVEVKTRRKVEMLSHQSFPMLLQFHLIIILDTII